MPPRRSRRRPRRRLRRGARACPSSCSRSASRRCRPRGCAGLGAQLSPEARRGRVSRVPRADGRARPVDAASARGSRRRSREPGRPRGAGLGTVAEGGEGRGGAWTGAAQGFAKKNGVAVTDLQQGPKDPLEADEIYLLFVKKIAGRAAGEVLPAVLASTLARPGLPEAHELGRVARRRQGRLPVRPAHPLAGRDARRNRGPVRDLRAGGRGEGQGSRGERSRDLRPSLPAPGRGRDVRRSCAVPSRAQGSAAASLRDPGSRGARAKHRGGARARDERGVAAGRPRARERNGATSWSTRPCSWARFPPSSARCPERCSRPSSSITRSTSPSRPGRRRRALRRRRPTATARSAVPPSSGAWSAWWSRGCATRRSSSRRTGSGRSPIASPTWRA